jgi:hypothetical protein
MSNPVIDERLLTLSLRLVVLADGQVRFEATSGAPSPRGPIRPESAKVSAATTAIQAILLALEKHGIDPHGTRRFLVSLQDAAATEAETICTTQMLRLLLGHDTLFTGRRG